MTILPPAQETAEIQDNDNETRSTNFGSSLDNAWFIPRIAEPKSYSNRTRWFLTAIVSMTACLDIVASNILYPSLHEIPAALHTTPTIVNLAIALPILSAAGSASTSPAGAAVISDIWTIQEKGRGVSWFYVGILSGPALGPVFGGLLSKRWEWRAPLWFLTIYGLAMLVLVILFLPNTQKRPQKAQDKQQNTSGNNTGTSRGARIMPSGFSLLKPLGIVSFLQYPIVLALIYIASIAFLIAKGFQISIQNSFVAPPYNFSPLSTGLTFLPFAAGLLSGDLGGAKWSDYLMSKHSTSKNQRNDEVELVCAPEERVGENAWAAMFVLPASLVWYGWSIQKETHWAIPIIAEVFTGVGVGLIFSLVSTVLVELLPNRSASLVAVNSLGRNILGVVGSSTAQPLISSIGNGWYCTILAITILLSSMILIPTKRNGQRWREALVNSQKNASMR